MKRDLLKAVEIRPLHGLTALNDEPRHALGLVDGDRVGDEVLRANDVDDRLGLPFGAVRPEDDGAHLRLERPNRHFVGQLSEGALELVEVALAADRRLGEIADDHVPVGVLGVELAQRRVIAGVRTGDEDRRASDRLVRHAREAPDELQGDAEAAMGVVHGGDLERRQVESLAEHVDADDDPALARAHLLERCVALVGRQRAVQHYRREVGRQLGV